MFRFARNQTLIAALALTLGAVPLLAGEPTVETFDYDHGGFDFRPDCGSIVWRKPVDR